MQFTVEASTEMAGGRHYTRYVLAPSQRRVIEDAAALLNPDRRHSFLLVVSRVLEMARNQHTNFCTDALVNRAISVALTETEGMLT